MIGNLSVPWVNLMVQTFHLSRVQTHTGNPLLWTTTTIIYIDLLLVFY